MPSHNIHSLSLGFGSVAASSAWLLSISTCLMPFSHDLSTRVCCACEWTRALHKAPNEAQNEGIATITTVRRCEDGVLRSLSSGVFPACKEDLLSLQLQTEFYTAHPSSMKPIFVECPGYGFPSEPWISF